MMTKFKANIVPLNAEKIGHKAHGTATFEIDDNQLTINIEMHDTPANIQHWEHFHGFPDGHQAEIATMDQDQNGDGFVDLPETEPVSGTTMVPFNDEPAKMDIPNDEYPVSDANGDFSYTRVVPLDQLEENFKKAFSDSNLELDKRVVYIHGIPTDVDLPESVAGEVGPYDAHVTLPIAVGKIEKA
ncbi:hypothetical protein ABVF11_07615 [Pediococcus argentinicus]|uniref:hypothetical protein n=1 Tax=Pediococcus argentinicus TaxID=480391 RepID=UPI0033901F59